ncbi:MAG: hypothetical protein QF511_04735 [Rhodospirillales bacterium]|jgi:hypothetical protein|nr:hypothetical protein [Rhodospirillales bacterium]MDP7097809.1 hypothetical protein [Rhodospirillales bacterium]MDP7216399.1 hypothetical protein [Rhodospirillales bacterium]HIJ44105.1 hypothetical protein [Rhodospirillaceae bacterium]HJP54967.1 hypothetical protein [Rhodospirillales bacterium]
MDGDWIIVVAVGVGAVVLGYLLLSLAAGVFVHALATAVDLFSWAAEGGFIGVALYIIVWVIAMPFMVVVCIAGGVIRLRAEWSEWIAGVPLVGGVTRLWAEWSSTRPGKPVNPTKPPNF